MKIAGREKIHDFIKKHAAAKGPLNTWLNIAIAEEWKTTSDIKRIFASASFLAENRVVFNIGGNKFRLVVLIRYTSGIISIERIGTHAEYNHWTL